MVTHVRKRNADAHAVKSPAGIDEASFVRIGGIEQWITIRGQNRGNPVLLFLHGGPGDVTNPWGYAYVAPWYTQFTIVEWDQRGAGRTLRKSGPSIAPTITVDRLVNDGIEFLKELVTRVRASSPAVDAGGIDAPPGLDASPELDASRDVADDAPVPIPTCLQDLIATCPLEGACRAWVNDGGAAGAPVQRLCYESGMRVIVREDPPVAFCGIRKQTTEFEERTVHELTHELLHFDSKIGRTLRLLLFSPGTLTRELIADRRVRYVGAIRLFLVSSVVLFGLLAFSAHHAETEEQRAENVSETLAELDQKLADPTTRWFERAVVTGARKVTDPTRLADRIVRALSWSSFLLVPVFALVTWRLFKRQQPFYIAHMYFALHLHAFAFLLLSAMTVLTLLRVPFSALGLGAFGLGTLVYFFVAIRRALNTSWVKTLLAGSVALAICVWFNAVVIGASLVGTLLLV